MSDVVETGGNRPLPDNFMEFIPWACKQLQLDCIIVMQKIQQHEYVSSLNPERLKKTKSKAKLQSRFEVSSDQDKDDNQDLFNTPIPVDSRIIHISSVYDYADNLIQVQFDKNKEIPRLLWKVIGLIVKFHTHLTSIRINGGMDQYTLHEICKFLNSSHITELILDNSFISEANFYLLFETYNELNHISLAGCDIVDDVLENIALKLAYTLPPSKKLRILNLSSNKITDDGAKHLAEALRSNRHLSYLNLANNKLTDVGAAHIFSSLDEFILSTDELMQARARQMAFLKRKNEVVKRAIQDLKTGDSDRKGARKKTLRPTSVLPTPKRGKIEKESSLKSLVDPNAKSLINVDALLYDKAVAIAENELGDFEDPFDSSNTIVKDGLMYCKGNNTLCYLNLAYNNLSYVCLNKIINLFKYQRSVDRKPSGLINLIIEGNPLPISCVDLHEIDDLIDTGLAAHRRTSGVKKRPHTKR